MPCERPGLSPAAASSPALLQAASPRAGERRGASLGCPCQGYEAFIPPPLPWSKPECSFPSHHPGPGPQPLSWGWENMETLGIAPIPGS